MKIIIVFLSLILLIVAFYPKKYSFGIGPGGEPAGENYKCLGVRIDDAMVGRTDTICYGITIK